VASYKEPLDWIRSVPSSWRVSLYNACEDFREFPEGVVATRLPNGGREASQWLRHIVGRYSSLSDFTVFLQGDKAHCVEEIDSLLNSDSTPPHSFCYVGAPCDNSSTAPPFLFPQTQELLSKAWLSEPIPPSAPFRVGAQFYARKAVILNRPVEHYCRLLEAVRNHGAAWSPAHLLEPVWGCVFDRKVTISHG
jgi:Protein of unknown function (DUF3431)